MKLRTTSIALLVLVAFTTAGVALSPTASAQGVCTDDDPDCQPVACVAPPVDVCFGVDPICYTPPPHERCIP